MTKQHYHKIINASKVRNCQKLKHGDLKLSNNSQRCIVNANDVVTNGVNYAVENVLSRMSESKQVPENSDILLLDSSEIVKNKLNNQLKSKCNCSLDSKIQQPSKIYYDENNQLVTNAIGDRMTQCSLDNLVDTIENTPDYMYDSKAKYIWLVIGIAGWYALYKYKINVYGYFF